MQGRPAPREDVSVAAESFVVSGIAGRYATALFELARESRTLDAVASDLDRIGALVAESPELTRLVRSPVFGRDEQARAILAVLDRAGISDTVRRFIGVAARNGRLFALADMIRDYRVLLAQHRGEMVAEVVSATALNERQLQAIRTALAGAAGREVSLRARTEPELIGGLVVKLGSRMVDASIRSKLNSLKVAMKGVG